MTRTNDVENTVDVIVGSLRGGTKVYSPINKVPSIYGGRQLYIREQV